MYVDPAGLGGAAQRITDALGALFAADPVHPPLASDATSVGAAGRLSVAGGMLAATFAEQTMGLALTAVQLARTGTGFAAVDEADAAALRAVSSGATAAGAEIRAAGWAPPPPPVPADVRPPLAPSPRLTGEALSTLMYAGNLGAGTSFASSWTELARSASDAARTVRGVAADLPTLWDGPRSADSVRAHLTAYADSLEASGERAGELARQAIAHGDRLSTARTDIPSPDEFAAVREQLTRAMQANAASGGRYAAVVAQLSSRLDELNDRAVEGHGRYHDDTDRTTAGSGDATEATPGDNSGELATLLPQLLPPVLQALGGVVGGLFGSVGQVPQALLQAGSQVAQSLGSMARGGLEPPPAILGDGPSLGGLGVGRGSGGGGGTVPTAGGAPRLAPSVPSTGRTPTAPNAPAGSLPSPAGTDSPAGGGLPMGGMPMGGTGGERGPGKDAARPKTLVVPPTPHTEAVTGKMRSDRIATSAVLVGERRGPTRTEEDAATDPDDEPPDPAGRFVRRITSTRTEGG